MVSNCLFKLSVSRTSRVPFLNGGCFRSPSCHLGYIGLTHKATFMPTYAQKASSDPVKLPMESQRLHLSLLPLWHFVLRGVWSLLNFEGDEHLHLVTGIIRETIHFPHSSENRVTNLHC